MDNKIANIVVLENGIKYTELSRVSYNDTDYVVLSNLSNPNDFCIRKLIKENNEDYIVGLDSKEEFDKIFALFSNKYMSETFN